jgi:type II secretory pathway pseudopilin PulG
MEVKAMTQWKSPGRIDRPAESSEAGYMLLAVIFMVALVLLSLAIAAPKVAAAIQRDRELELVHRGEQYKRAIRLYYKKFGSYPSSIDQLEKTNNIRFLRKRYLDPLTGKDDWKPILVGQAHVCPLGFFGQPLGTGAALAGATAAASLAAQSSTLGAGSSSSGGFGSSSSGGFGSSSSGSSGFGSSTGTAGGLGAAGSTGTGCGTTGTGGQGLNGPGASSTDSSGSAGSSGSGFGGSTGSSTGSLGGGTSTSTTLGGGNTNSTGFGAATSTTLGGAPMMGVEPPMTKATILAYKLKTKYNEWEFAYWPAEDQAAASGILGGSGSVNGAGNTVNGPGSSGSSSGTSGGLSSSGGGGFGGASGSGSGGSSQSSTTPQ